MPNLNARYTRDDISATTWEGDYPACAACGRTSGIFEVHHEPPRSKGSLLLLTDMGRFVVKPALLTLCKACHVDRHEGRLSISWEFDSEEDEGRFWDGWFLSHGYGEHDPKFFRHGRIVLERRGQRWEIRR
jgi:hypothetical protein